MSIKPIFSSDRFFEVWHYTVSHRQLLTRSNKDNSSPTRLEVLFKDVAFMGVPTIMKGMVISECHAVSELPADLDTSRISKPWYRIEADGILGYVAAGAMVSNEDDLGYEEPSPLCPRPFL